jgi:ribulose-phosphate 3-epimerase
MNQTFICPTVTAFNPHDYRAQVEQLETFATRIHIDLMDGQFAPTLSPPLGQIWLPNRITSDIHLMYRQPMDYIKQLVDLMPNLVIIHSEAEVNFKDFADRLHQAGIKAGLALLSETTVESCDQEIKYFDHVLIFSGKLGFHGGQADLGLLDKVNELHKKYEKLELSWDGGINDENAKKLIEAGISVLNVGGFIHNAVSPKQAYAKLLDII